MISKNVKRKIRKIKTIAYITYAILFFVSVVLTRLFIDIIKYIKSTFTTIY